MTYENFISEYIEELQKQMNLKEDAISRLKVQSVNNNERDTLIIKDKNSPIAPTIYPADEYEVFQRGYSIKEIVDNTKRALANLPKTENEIPKITAEVLAESAYCVVVNAIKNAELLKNVPHEKFEDLAIVPRCKVDEHSSYIIKNNVCQHVHLTPEEVLEMAHKNTDKEKFVCQNMNEILYESLMAEGLPREYVNEIVELKSPLYVLTNPSRYDGAVAITSKQVMEQAYETVKKDYPEMKDMYVLGSSRHELLLISDTEIDSLETLKEIHQEVQSVQVAEEEKLTEHIYKYDGITKKLSIADVPVLSENETLAKENIKLQGRSR